MEEVTSKDLQYITNQMEEIKKIVGETNKTIKGLEYDFVNHKIQINEQINNRVTYKQVIAFGAWFVGVLMACLGVIAAFFSLKQ